MSLRVLILLGSLCSAMFVVSVACGGAKKCDATSCASGCCAADGTCQAGTASAACGTKGAACSACATGQSCNANVCVGSSGTGGGAGGGSGGGAGGGSGVDGGGIGASCASIASCTSGVCATDPSLPGGYCTADCTTNAAVCGSTASCSDSFNYATASGCMAHCTNGTAGQDTCRAGYVCELFWVANTSQPVCAPACTQASQCPAPDDGGVTEAKCEGGYCCGLSLFKCCAAGPACVNGSPCDPDGYCP